MLTVDGSILPSFLLADNINESGSPVAAEENPGGSRGRLVRPSQGTSDTPFNLSRAAGELLGYERTITRISREIDSCSTEMSYLKRANDAAIYADSAGNLMVEVSKALEHEYHIIRREVGAIDQNFYSLCHKLEYNIQKGNLVKQRIISQNSASMTGSLIDAFDTKAANLDNLKRKYFSNFIRED